MITLTQQSSANESGGSHGYKDNQVLMSVVAVTATRIIKLMRVVAVMATGIIKC